MTILGLRTCKKDGTSYNGFKWTLTPGAIVDAPDWDARPICGGGLHFLPWGEGDASLLDWTDNAIALVIEPIGDVVNIDDHKSKCSSARVIFVGELYDCAQYIYEHGGIGRRIHGVTATAGDEGTATAGSYGTATAGYKGTATAGSYGTATAGYKGTATAGYKGTATAGYKGTATAGYKGTATAGDEGTATAGNGGTATAGDEGTATAGNGGTATAGYKGTATAGDEGTATAGYKGTATAGNGGTIAIRYWIGHHNKVAVGTIGNDLKPDTKYRVDETGTFIRASSDEATK